MDSAEFEEITLVVVFDEGERVALFAKSPRIDGAFVIRNAREFPL